MKGWSQYINFHTRKNYSKMSAKWRQFVWRIFLGVSRDSLLKSDISPRSSDHGHPRYLSMWSRGHSVKDRKSQRGRSQNLSPITPLKNPVNHSAAAMLDCGKGVDNCLFKQWRWPGIFIARSTTHIFGYEIIYNATFVHKSFSIESDYAEP